MIGAGYLRQVLEMFERHHRQMETILGDGLANIADALKQKQVNTAVNVSMDGIETLLRRHRHTSNALPIPGELWRNPNGVLVVYVSENRFVDPSLKKGSAGRPGYCIATGDVARLFERGWKLEREPVELQRQADDCPECKSELLEQPECATCGSVRGCLSESSLAQVDDEQYRRDVQAQLAEVAKQEVVAPVGQAKKQHISEVTQGHETCWVEGCDNVTLLRGHAGEPLCFQCGVKLEMPGARDRGAEFEHDGGGA